MVSVQNIVTPTRAPRAAAAHPARTVIAPLLADVAVGALDPVLLAFFEVVREAAVVAAGVVEAAATVEAAVWLARGAVD